MSKYGAKNKKKKKTNTGQNNPPGLGFLKKNFFFRTVIGKHWLIFKKSKFLNANTKKIHIFNTNLPKENRIYSSGTSIIFPCHLKHNNFFSIEG